MTGYTHPSLQPGAVWASNDHRDIRDGRRQHRVIAYVDQAFIYFAGPPRARVRRDHYGCPQRHRLVRGASS